MKKNSTAIAFITFAIPFSACKKEKKTLISTNWKLESFVNVNTGEIKEAEPKRDHCYILTFKRNGKLEGRSSSNSFEGRYNIKHTKHNINISIQQITLAGEFPDGYTYMESLFNADFFSVQENELKLYYNNKQCYLLFRPKEQ
jgi:hypothetical protein